MLVSQSNSGYAETVLSLKGAIGRRGLTVFARIDHAAGAHDAGMELEDEEVVLFGNPLSGTPLMQDDRRIGVELPLRMLIWREGERVLLGYRDPLEWAEEYEVAAHEATLRQMAKLLEELAREAAA